MNSFPDKERISRHNLHFERHLVKHHMRQDDKHLVEQDEAQDYHQPQHT